MHFSFYTVPVRLPVLRSLPQSPESRAGRRYSRRGKTSAPTWFPCSSIPGAPTASPGLAIRWVRGMPPHIQSPPATSAPLEPSRSPKSLRMKPATTWVAAIATSRQPSQVRSATTIPPDTISRLPAERTTAPSWPTTTKAPAGCKFRTIPLRTHSTKASRSGTNRTTTRGRCARHTPPSRRSGSRQAAKSAATIRLGP
mgnify:CR=1 FL=1